MVDAQSFRHAGRARKSWSAVLIGSYVFDWIVLIAIAGTGAVMGIVEPNKRPFSLLDPNISFPFTEHETVPTWLLMVVVVIVPAVFVLIVALVFVPGNTVPKGTPKSLIWKRKLWELHVGWLGLALSVASAWFITNGMKNMFGKPRPDLLSRCEPDLENISKYIVGGIANSVANGQLVSADICQSTDSGKLDDGFRSYPSGHSSSSAAGLIYLSLFLASKFAVTLPFVAPGADGTSHGAFPSRLRNGPSPYEPVRTAPISADTGPIAPDSTTAAKNLAVHEMVVTSVRRQAAAPPLYLLVIVVIPFFGSVFIAGSRWFDFRHHGFDILFGYLIGTITSIFAFRYYHLPIRQGAGWAWGPRSHDKAWWGGVGSYSYATHTKGFVRPGDEEEGFDGRDSDRGSSTQIGAKGGNNIIQSTDQRI